MTPIIIFHLGKKEYPKYCIDQALKYKNKVYFITDCVEYYHRDDKSLHLVDYNNYKNLEKKFAEKYKHYSTNPHYYELICILRWIVVKKLMEELGIVRAFICDSDVLIYDNITQIDDKYLKDEKLWLCTTSTKNVTGGQSIWTLDKLSQFCNFIDYFYDTQIPNIEKWKASYNQPGGVCDMTLIYYFCHNNITFNGLRLPGFPRFKNDLTNILENSFTFDLHLRELGNHLYPKDYEKDSIGNKKINYNKGIPYCYNTRLEKDIRFVLLHFQGSNKRFMKEFYLKGNLK